MDYAIGFDASAQKRLIGQSDVSISISSLVSNALREADDALQIVIDPKNRVVAYGTDNIIAAQIEAVAGHKTATFAPDANQDGRSVTWSKTAQEAGFHEATGSAVEAITAAAKPRMTLESFVARAIDAIPEGQEPFVVIDQQAGTVKLLTVTIRAGAEAVVNTYNPAGGTGALISLATPADAPVAERLKFEGGAV